MSCPFLSLLSSASSSEDRVRQWIYRVGTGADSGLQGGECGADTDTHGDLRLVSGLVFPVSSGGVCVCVDRVDVEVCVKEEQNPVFFLISVLSFLFL